MGQFRGPLSTVDIVSSDCGTGSPGGRRTKIFIPCPAKGVDPDASSRGSDVKGSSSLWAPAPTVTVSQQTRSGNKAVLRQSRLGVVLLFGFHTVHTLRSRVAPVSQLPLVQTDALS